MFTVTVLNLIHYPVYRVPHTPDNTYEALSQARNITLEI